MHFFQKIRKLGRAMGKEETAMGYLVDGNLTGKDMLHPLGTAYEYSDGILPEAVDGEPTAVFSEV